jgi:hypothetical protein
MRTVNGRGQQLCIWGGPLAMAMFLVGLLLCGFLPPPSPADNPEQVAAMFQDRTNFIRIGLLFLAFGGAFFCPWVAAITVQMKRIEGQFAPLSYTQLGVGVLIALEVIFPAFFWQTAAFRPATRDPGIIQTLNDMSWLPIDAVIETTVVQALAVGTAILLDDSEHKVYPRWLGYLSFWAALLQCTSSMAVFFKTGPFAWNGILSWWMVVAVFGIWLVAMTVMTMKAIKRQIMEAQQVTLDAARV